MVEIERPEGSSRLESFKDYCDELSGGVDGWTDG